MSVAFEPALVASLPIHAAQDSVGSEGRDEEQREPRTAISSKEKAMRRRRANLDAYKRRKQRDPFFHTRLVLAGLAFDQDANACESAQAESSMRTQSPSSLPCVETEQRCAGPSIPVAAQATGSSKVATEAQTRCVKDGQGGLGGEPPLSSHRPHLLPTEPSKLVHMSAPRSSKTIFPFSSRFNVSDGPTNALHLWIHTDGAQEQTSVYPEPTTRPNAAQDQRNYDGIPPASSSERAPVPLSVGCLPGSPTDGSTPLLNEMDSDRRSRVRSSHTSSIGMFAASFPTPPHRLQADAISDDGTIMPRGSLETTS